jgi:hypothetical protein
MCTCQQKICHHQLKSEAVSGMIPKKFLEHLKDDVDHHQGWPRELGVCDVPK